MPPPTAARIYLDHNATAPLAAEAREAVLRCLEAPPGNPSSTHRSGQEARAVVEEARQQIASEAGASPEEVVFVSGGTEADNLALRGVMTARSLRDGRRHLLVSAVEHPAVLETAHSLAESGYEVDVVPVDGSGRVDPAALEQRLRPDTAMVSIMAANHETGIFQPVTSIARLLRPRGITFHIDAVQALPHAPVSLESTGADLLSFSAHKLGGPKGIGALLIREGVPFVSPMTGGAQQGRRRAGTESPELCAGFSAAVVNLRRRPDRVRALRDRLELELSRRVSGATVLCAGVDRLPNTSCVQFRGLPAQSLVVAFDLEGLAVSHGAACASGMSRPSHVLKAMGLSDIEARSCIRFSLGAGTTAAEIDQAVNIVERVTARMLRVTGERLEARA